MIESDSLQVVQLISNDEECFTAEGVLVDEVRRLLASQTQVLAQCLWNTHQITCYSLRQERLCFWLENGPPLMQSCVQEDLPTRSHKGSCLSLFRSRVRRS